MTSGTASPHTPHACPGLGHEHPATTPRILSQLLTEGLDGWQLPRRPLGPGVQHRQASSPPPSSLLRLGAPALASRCSRPPLCAGLAPVLPFIFSLQMCWEPQLLQPSKFGGQIMEFFLLSVHRHLALRGLSPEGRAPIPKGGHHSVLLTTVSPARAQAWHMTGTRGVLAEGKDR